MNLFWLWLALLPKMPDANKLHMLQLAGDPEALYRADRKAFYALSPEEKRWHSAGTRNLSCSYDVPLDHSVR